MKMFCQKTFELFVRALPYQLVERYYVKAGAIFGDAVSMLHMGECIGFEDMLARWARWEKEYSRLGYQALPVDFFVRHGGYGDTLEGLGKKLEPDEDPVLHAKLYRQHFLGKVRPVIDLGKLMRPGVEEVQYGTCVVPSTKNLS